jgi:Ca2+:H+ antiporter
VAHANARQSNYFKGSILCLTYLVIIMGYYLAGLDWEAQGIDRFELAGYTESSRSFKTIGRGKSGMAY